MIVVHAGIHEGQLFLWGETPIEGEVRPARQRGRKPKTPRPVPLPYDAGPEKLLEALAEAGSGVGVDRKRIGTGVIWLPTAGSVPVASSPLIAEPLRSRAKITLTPWTISVLNLTAEESVEFLCTCVNKQTLAPGVIVSNDLKFCTEAMRFAGTLVAQQQFLPGVREDNGLYYARWKPILVGPNAVRLAKLAGAMPGVSRALTPEISPLPEISPSYVLSNFVGEIVDYMVRSAASLEPSPTKSGHRRKLKPPAFESIHDQWLYSLRLSDGLMKGSAAELAGFAAQIREWQRPISVSASSPFRLCFRLEEPEEDRERRAEHASPRRGSGEWYVRYLLQAVDDPSLLIPGKDIWNARGRKARIFKHRNFNVREYMLSSLGQASGICPYIENSLKASTPGGYKLDTSGAYGFLTEKALLLEQAGFRVMLPAWWTRKGTKLRLTAHADVKSPKMQGGSGMSLGQIVQFDWEIALGDERLSFEELKALAELKSPLVKVRGQWVQMSAEEIQTALDFWKKKASDSATVREIVQMALGMTKASGAIPFEGVTAEGWIGDLLARLEGHSELEESPTPDGFQGTLRTYQVRGYSWLDFLRQWGLGSCLADDMGLGKTIQVLALIQKDWESNGKRPVLVICPMSVVSNWQKEAARFTPELPVMIHHGIARTKGTAFRREAGKHAIVISSYALLHRDFEILKKVNWSGVVLDEAQNIKNPETKQAKSARSLKTDYRIALTGTPVENNVGDLWSIIEFLNPGFLRTQTEFKRTFFVPIQANRDPEATERLKRLTGPFILRRLKTDKSVITDLPEKMEMKVFCTLTKEQASLYAAVLKETEESLDSAEGIQRRGVILATLSKLKQVCNHPAQFLGDNSAIPGRSGKLARLTEMLEEVVEVGDRTLIFSQFAEMGGILQRHLQETFGQEVLFLHGAVSKKQRDHMIERFQASDGGPQIFVLSLKAGGTGLNLTRANHVFHFDRWWNPAVENQATDRAFRIGQTRDVQVHKFICAGTFEEKIDEMIERKKEIAEQVVGAGENWLTELSTADLKELFALRKEAVGE